jgi:S-adenosylmethionine decarboxylase
MIVGTEWLVEAEECNENPLRDEATLRRIFARIVNDLGLKTLNEPLWHTFGGAGGVTGLVMLTESHLACHTYPEYKTATFNLYCCRARPEWDWEANLRELLGAERVRITKIERGDQGSATRNPKSKIQNPKSQVVGGEV